VNIPGVIYGNALHAASARDHLEVVKLLLDRGAEVNTPGESYRNPLQAASLNGHQEVVELLLERGAENDFEKEQHSDSTGSKDYMFKEINKEIWQEQKRRKRCRR